MVIAVLCGWCMVRLTQFTGRYSRKEEMENMCAGCWWGDRCADKGKALCKCEDAEWEDAPWEPM